MSLKIRHAVELFGPRYTKYRRIGNIAFLVVVTATLAWLIGQNSGQGERITNLERSDCKEARITGDRQAQEACFATSDFSDRNRPIPGLCIRSNRTGYPCPLTEEQQARLQAVIGN